tara:strand:+ start:1230 stop:1439 length:210 start_codon:yes stop_codon:yes gene_type:complete
MKLVLVVYICSSLYNQCKPPMYVSEHNTWYDCMTAGYNESLNVSKKTGEEKINKNLIYFNFSCKKIDIT